MMAQKSLTHSLNLLRGDVLKECVGNNVRCILSGDKTTRCSQNVAVSIFLIEQNIFLTCGHDSMLRSFGLSRYPINGWKLQAVVA